MNHIKSFLENYDSSLKLYHFGLKPGEYDLEYTILSTDAQSALEAVVKCLEKDEYSQYNYKLWKDATLDNLPDGYVLKEFGLNEVVVTERS